jgi:hypothetical protein
VTEEQRRIIAELSRSPGFAELKKWAYEQRDVYLKSLGKALFTNPDLVTASALREKAAYFRGQRDALNAPFFSANQLKTMIDKDGE